MMNKDSEDMPVFKKVTAPSNIKWVRKSHLPLEDIEFRIDNVILGKSKRPVRKVSDVEAYTAPWAHEFEDIKQSMYEEYTLPEVSGDSKELSSSAVKEERGDISKPLFSKPSLDIKKKSLAMASGISKVSSGAISSAFSGLQSKSAQSEEEINEELKSIVSGSSKLNLKQKKKKVKKLKKKLRKLKKQKVKEQKNLKKDLKITMKMKSAEQEMSRTVKKFDDNMKKILSKSDKTKDETIQKDAAAVESIFLKAKDSGKKVTDEKGLQDKPDVSGGTTAGAVAGLYNLTKKKVKFNNSSSARDIFSVKPKPNSDSRLSEKKEASPKASGNKRSGMLNKFIGSKSDVTRKVAKHPKKMSLKTTFNKTRVKPKKHDLLKIESEDEIIYE